MGRDGVGSGWVGEGVTDMLTAPVAADNVNKVHHGYHIVNHNPDVILGDEPLVREVHQWAWSNK